MRGKGQQCVFKKVVNNGNWVTTTVQLGNGLITADDFCNEIKRQNGLVNDSAMAMMNSDGFKVASHLIEIDLVIATGKDLTHKDFPTLAEIFVAAERLGWEKCPPEVAPQLRRKYLSQPRGEYLFIGMEPIAGLADRPGIFVVCSSGDDLWLETTTGYLDRRWSGDTCCVFVRPR